MPVVSSSWLAGAKRLKVRPRASSPARLYRRSFCYRLSTARSTLGARGGDLGTEGGAESRLASATLYGEEGEVATLVQKMNPTRQHMAVLSACPAIGDMRIEQMATQPARTKDAGIARN
ncbi:MAG: hypothetical protein M3340_04115 [Actinomycetota bacterium]|nr:hypothetical protein [Actinomycetota bacterium]